MPEFLIIVGGLFVLLLVGGITFFGVRAGLRRRYVASLTSRGWTFVDNPTLAEVAMLHSPPFGRQFDRAADELVRGRTRDGYWFQAFDYRTTEFDNRVLTIRLPRALPELFVLAGQRPRPGVRAAAVRGFDPLLVNCADQTYARALLTPAVMSAIVAYGRLHPLDLAIDGNHLVAVGASTDAEVLSRSAEALAAVVRAIDSAVFDRYALPDPVPGYTFHGRPDWTFLGAANHLLTTVELSGGGQAHRIAEAVTSTNNGLPFVALQHHWQTTYTTTSTDANGNTTTTTHTNNHVEYLMEFTLAFRSPPLAVAYDNSKFLRGWVSGLREIDFEHGAFNDVFDIRCGSTRFAYDVIHPRQMEYLAQTHPPAFVWGDGRASFRLTSYTQESIEWICDFFTGFIARVPSFVWKDLHTPPPVRLIEA